MTEVVGDTRTVRDVALDRIRLLDAIGQRPSDKACEPMTSIRQFPWELQEIATLSAHQDLFHSYSYFLQLPGGPDAMSSRNRRSRLQYCMYSSRPCNGCTVASYRQLVVQLRVGQCRLDYSEYQQQSTSYYYQLLQLASSSNLQTSTIQRENTNYRMVSLRSVPVQQPSRYKQLASLCTCTSSAVGTSALIVCVWSSLVSGLMLPTHSVNPGVRYDQC